MIFESVRKMFSETKISKWFSDTIMKLQIASRMCGAHKTKKLTILNQRGSELKGKKNIFVLVRIALGTSQVQCIEILESLLNRLIFRVILT